MVFCYGSPSRLRQVERLALGGARRAHPQWQEGRQGTWVLTQLGVRCGGVGTGKRGLLGAFLQWYREHGEKLRVRTQRYGGQKSNEEAANGPAWSSEDIWETLGIPLRCVVIWSETHQPGGMFFSRMFSSLNGGKGNSTSDYNHSWGLA